MGVSHKQNHKGLMTETETFILLGILVFMSWVYYHLQQKIGLQQTMDWEDFKKDNPFLFKKSNTISTQGQGTLWSDEQKKST